MKKVIMAVSLVLAIISFSHAGDRSEKAGEVVGKAAKETKEAGKVLIDATKKGAKKTGEFFKELYEDSKDFKDGVKEGYSKD